MLDEVTIHKLSQLVYLDVPAEIRRAGPPTVQALADYYVRDPVGQAFLATRFGGIPAEYEGWKAFLAEGVAELGDYRIRNVLDDNGADGTGFYGCCYLSPQGDLVGAFRGSEMLGNRRYRNDYETDFALAYTVQTPQQQVVVDYLRLFGEFRARPYYLTGHSLGGNLALYGAVAAPDPDRLLGCYAFNAPGFCGEFAAEQEAAIAAVWDRLYPLQNEHDLVSSLLIGIGEPVVVQSVVHPRELDRPGAAEILYPHSNFQFVPEGVALARAPSGKKDALCNAVEAVTGLFLLLPVFVRKALARMVLDVLYSAQPPEKQMEFLLERITRFLVQSGTERGSLALSGGLYLARQMAANDITGDQLYRELLDGGLDEPSYLGRATVLLLDLVRHRCRGESCAD